MKPFNKKIESVDCEAGNGVIVTLCPGYSFFETWHESVRGFDSKSEALSMCRQKDLYACDCGECKSVLPDAEMEQVSP